MNPGATICGLPTWDYATVGYLLSSLPSEVRNALNFTQYRCLQMLVYLCGLQCRKSGRGALYATPGQAYLGRKTGRSARTIRRCLTVLVNSSLLSIQRRGPTKGQPQTNLYQLGSQLLALLHNIKWPKSVKKSHKDTSGRQRPKEKVRHRARSSSGVSEEWRDSHKPADLSSLPVPGGGERLPREVVKHGFAAIRAKIRGAIQKDD